MDKKWQRLVIASISVALLVLVAGCSKSKVATDEGMAMSPDEQQAADSADRGDGMESQGMAMADEPLETMSDTGAEEHLILEGRTHAPLLPVYFDFDNSNIRQDQQPRIEKNADYLKANPRVAVRVEGNCDERGTSEYNLALGERRALSAKKYLVNLGIDGNRIDTLSYGENSPLVRGHDELAWAQNRRADFVFSK